jgi:hypothetical protein
MTHPELKQLEQKLINDSIFSEFCAPLTESFEEIKYNPKIYNTLSMPLFSSLGCLRHLQGNIVLREFVQTLYHLTEEEKLPFKVLLHENAF